MPSWQSRIIGYAIGNYFPAFIRGKLELVVETTTVNQANFDALINDQEFLETLEKQDSFAYAAVQQAKWYVKCLDEQNPTLKVETKQLSPQPGKSEFRLIIEEDAPRLWDYSE